MHAIIASMKPYEPKTFSIPALQGISLKTIEEHLNLYQGYVKNAHLVLEKIREYSTDFEKNSYILGELQRRFSFEFNGIRNHEYYFEQLEGGASPLSETSLLHSVLPQFKITALTRGIGWAIIYWDHQLQQLTLGWVDEQHLGHLVGLTPILMLDMWEHSYVADYQPSGKKRYIDDYLASINWSVVERRLEQVNK